MAKKNLLEKYWTEPRLPIFMQYRARPLHAVAHMARLEWELSLGWSGKCDTNTRDSREEKEMETKRDPFEGPLFCLFPLRSLSALFCAFFVFLSTRKNSAKTKERKDAALSNSTSRTWRVKGVCVAVDGDPPVPPLQSKLDLRQKNVSTKNV